MLRSRVEICLILVKLKIFNDGDTGGGAVITLRHVNLFVKGKYLTIYNFEINISYFGKIKIAFY